MLRDTMIKIVFTYVKVFHRQDMFYVFFNNGKI